MSANKTPTPLKDLKVGDLIYADIVVHPADMADPTSKSTTATKIKQGKPVRRICIVLETGTHSVRVTYVATFDQSTTLPTALDKTLWYPFKPAAKEGALQPLPELPNGRAQWASLRTRQTITKDPSDKLSMSLPESSANHIKAHMRA